MLREFANKDCRRGNETARRECVRHVKISSLETIWKSARLLKFSKFDIDCQLYEPLRILFVDIY